MQSIYDLIIIGGGPAGITAGIYGARKKIKTLLLSKDFTGQVGKTLSIENYPGFFQISGLDLIKNFLDQLKNFEIEIKEGEEVREIQKKEGFFEVFTIKNHYQARAILIASGRDPRKLKIPGEEKFIGRGISFCEICDAPLFTGKTVAVIGGGNAGFEAALDLAKYSPKIYILEASSQVKADLITQERVRTTGKVEIIPNTAAKEIKGDNFVEGLIYEDRQTGKTNELAVQGIFVEIGSVPSVAFAKDLVDFNERGEIKKDPRTCETKTPGIFAAGDCTDVKYKQIIVAAGEGAKAALSAYDYLTKSGS